MILGGFGFMGMLALGFSHILVPMFALVVGARTAGTSMAGFAMAAAALALGTVGALAAHRGL